MARAVEQSAAAPGRDVADLVDAALRARGILTPEDACALLAPLPAAIQTARDAGSILRLPRGTNRETRAVLAALGLAAPPRPRSGEPMPFRAPEQGPDTAPTPASDVYAVAGLIRTAITGHEPPPWTLANLAATADAPALSGAFGAVLWDALADDPAQRPPSVQTLLDDATRALTAPAPDPDIAPATPETRRLRRIAAGAAAAFLFGVVVAISAGGAERETPARIAMLPPGPAAAASGAVADAAFADDMAQAMRRLNVRRTARRERLRVAETRTAQSRAATELADAYGIAARSVRRAPIPANAREDTAAIVDALLLTESAYRTMARGARDGDRAQFVRGRDAVRRREALLQRRIQRLAALGYTVR